jgi:alkylation response protein AidB-like acyl-CoA dehydrogenase
MHSTASSQATNRQIAWERVRSLEAIVIAHRREGDLVRRLPDAVARAFLDLDMYRLLVPEDLGGLGIDPFTFFDLCIELSAYDGSVGWNFGIGAGSISVIGSFPLERLRAIFGSPDCGIAGSIFPPGQATRVEGGYKFTGRWAWASGIHNARWVNGLAIVYDGETMLIRDGEPVVIKAQFARDDVQIEDSWHVGGMKGTGSTEFSLTDHFVRDQDTFEPFTAASHPDPIFALPVSFLGMPLCAVAIGVATGTSRAFKAFLLNSKSGSKEQGYAQYALAKAEAICESAQLYVKEAFRPIWRNAAEGVPTTMEQRGRARRAYVLATEQSIEAVDLCYHAAGGSAVFDSDVFHRNLSDVHVISMHQLLQRKMMEKCGQASLGLPVTDPSF